MPANPNTAEPAKPRRRWFQFRLRTLLIAVALLGILLSQLPLVEWAPPVGRVPITDGHTIYKFADPGPSGHYFIPDRVLQVAAAEAVAVLGWLLLKWMRRRE